MSDRYTVIFEGRIMPGKNADMVKERLKSALKTTDQGLAKLFTGSPVAIRKNKDLATASHQISQAMRELSQHLPKRSKSLSRLVVKNVMRFAGDPLSAEEIETIINEAYSGGSNEPEEG